MSYGNHREGLEGGQLAASFSPAERMEMVSRGYNPMSSTDVERYLKRQKPAEGLMEHAGVTKFRNLGGGLDVAPSDMGLVKGSGFDEFVQSANISSDPKSAMKSAMNSYSSGAGFSGLDERLNSLANKSQSHQRINESKKTTLITDAVQAKKVGYMFGTRYIKAFLENKKTPTKLTKEALLKETNNLKAAESKIHPSLLQQYNDGISYAEKEAFKNK
jgi:hypothetical protein